MDTILSSIGGSVPEMVAMIIVVLLFLRFLNSENALIRMNIENQNKAWRDYLTLQNTNWQTFIDAQMTMVVRSLKDTTSDINGLGAKFEKLENIVMEVSKRMIIHETYVNTAIEAMKKVVAGRDQNNVG